MRIRCMVCKKEWLNMLKLPDSLPQGSVSHGLCPACAKKMNEELDRREAEKAKQNEDNKYPAQP